MEKLMKIMFMVFLLVPLTMGAASAQKRTVTGNVTDGSGEPLIGVNIMEKGTSNGTITDLDGNYSISVEEGATLVLSFIGHETQEVLVEGKSVVDVKMISTDLGLDEVIVVGYGTQKKSDIISSVVSIKPESATKVPTTDVGEMLRGKAAGVFVSLDPDNGGPGGGSKILIRGQNSMSADNDPIIIADGVRIGSINDVNPNDIASLEILKDAAAQAIYGARASNGVILITTKRGAKGKASVKYSGYYGLQTINKSFETYSAEEYAQLKREAFRADNNNQYLPDEDIFTATELDVLNSGDFVDWEEHILQLAPIQNHNLSISSGNETTKVYSSINYTNQEGVVKGTDYQKGTVRLNIDKKVTDWLSFGANTSWQLSKKNTPGTGNTLQRLVTTSPLGKIYNEDGTYKLNPTDVQESFNPLMDLETVSYTKEDRNDIMNLFMDVKPFKGFNYRLNASRRSWNRKSIGYNTAESLQGYYNGQLGEGEIRFQDNVEWQFENILTYDLQKDVHNFGATFVQSVTHEHYSDFKNEANKLPNDIVDIYGLAGAESNTPSINSNKRRLLSFVGRIQYSYDNKYYLTLSARADGSSVFGANNKWGYFPAAAIGWNIYRERFLEDVEVITNLKLRASYGSVGNQAIDPYQSLSLADSRDYIFNDKKTSGYVPGSYLPNPNLKWETSTTLNTALDFGFFSNRLSGTVEYYNTRTTDQLVKKLLNSSSGYTTMWYNIGEIENQGVEFNINGAVVDKGDLKINLGVSFSRNRNKIISLYGEDADGDGKEDDDIANEWFIGQPINVTYGYRAVGIWQEGEDIVNSHMPNMEPGDIKLFDRDPTDGELNDDDRVITPTDPKWFGSFNYSMTFKGVDFSFDILTVQGKKRWNNYLYGYNEGGSLRGILNGIKQDYWTPENPTGNWPRPQESNDRSYIWTLALQDASYIRLQSVTLGYTFPKSLLSKIKLGSVRVYCTGHNLVTLTKYQSYSPEKNANEYPEMVSVVGGIQIGF